MEMNKIISFSSKLNPELQSIIKETYCEMNYSKDSRNIDLIQEWLKINTSRFEYFDDKKCIIDSLKSYVNYNQKQLCNINIANTNVVKQVLKDSTVIFSDWKNGSYTKRVNIINNIISMVNKRQDLILALENLCIPNFIYDRKSFDVSNIIKSFKNAKEWALTWENESHNLQPLGIVVLITRPNNCPLSSYCDYISMALASGNCVILCPGLQNCLTSYLLKEICEMSSLPNGVFNVLPYETEQQCMELLKSLGNYEEDTNLCQLKILTNYEFPMLWEEIISEKSSKMLNIEFDACYFCPPSVIVLEDSDLRSAVECIIECLCSVKNMINIPCEVFVQDAIKNKLMKKLQPKLDQLNINPGDLTNDSDENGITKMNGINLRPFRTVKEAVAMFNHRKMNNDVCVWSEKLSVSLGIASQLRAKNISINCQNETYNAVNNRYDGIKYGFMKFVKLKKDSKPESKIDKKSENKDGVEISVQDVLKVVQSAKSAQNKWANMEPASRVEFFRKISADFRKSVKDHEILTACTKRVENAFRKCVNTVQCIQNTKMIMHMKEPLGVIAIVFSKHISLLNVLNIILNTVAAGNAVIIVHNFESDVSFLKLFPVFLNGKNLPPGVVNFLCGNQLSVSLRVAQQSGVDAIWLDEDLPHAEYYELKKVVKLKRMHLWITDMEDDTNLQLNTDEFMYQSTYSKTIYLTMGDTLSPQ